MTGRTRLRVPGSGLEAIRSRPAGGVRHTAGAPLAAISSWGLRCAVAAAAGGGIHERRGAAAIATGNLRALDVLWQEPGLPLLIRLR